MLFCRKREIVFPESADAQLPSAQNNPYLKMAYFGVACSDALHCFSYPAEGR